MYIINNEEPQPLEVLGVYSPETYQNSLSRVQLNLNDAQKKTICQLSKLLGISGSDIIKAIRYYAYDRKIPLTTPGEGVITTTYIPEPNEDFSGVQE